MQIKRPLIKLENIQIKSLYKAKKLSKSLEVIEEECGIHEVRITIVNPFICPWIDLEKLSSTPMERLLRDLLKQL